MMSNCVKLNSREMAEFAAEGLLRFDGIVPDVINQQFLAEAGSVDTPNGEKGSNRTIKSLGNLMAHSSLPEVTPGTVLNTAYKETTALGELVRLPVVRGAIESLVGPESMVDHIFCTWRYQVHTTKQPVSRSERSIRIKIQPSTHVAPSIFSCSISRTKLDSTWVVLGTCRVRIYVS